MKTIVFICTGNTCRSVLAHALMWKQQQENPRWRHLEVQSAGIAAIEGEKPADYALEILESRDIDFTSHRSQLLSRELVNKADLVLVMTFRHLQRVISCFPEARDKTHLLSEFAAGDKVDIADPIGGDREVYQQTARQLERYINRLWDKLEQQKQ